MIAAFIERNPLVGIGVSFSGFGASVLSILHILSIVFGFGGAVFGLAAGYYTYRVKRAEWGRVQTAARVIVKKD